MRILAAILIFFPALAFGAISHDAMSSAQQGGSNSEPLTIVHITTTADNVLMVVCLGWRFAADTVGVKYKDVSLIELRQDDGDSGFSHGEIWYLFGPATGANDLVVDQGTTSQLAVVINTYSGVNPNNLFPVEAADCTDGSPVDVVITTGVANSWIFGCGSTQDFRTMTEINSFVSRDEAGSGTGIGTYGEDRGPLSAGSFTPGWTHTAGAIDNCIAAVELVEHVGKDLAQGEMATMGIGR